MNIISVTIHPKASELNPVLTETAALGSSSTSSVGSPTSLPQKPQRAHDAANLVWLQVKGLEITSRGKKVDQTAIEFRKYVFYNDKELAERELVVKEGRVYQFSSPDPLSTDTRKMIWVMHPDGKIYVDFPKEESLFHSSLMNGKKPIAAGELRAHVGRITLLTEQSGHYEPIHRVQIVLKHLQFLGLDVTEIKIKEAIPPRTRHRLKVNPSPPTSSDPMLIDRTSPAGSIKKLHETPVNSAQPAKGCCTVS